MLFSKNMLLEVQNEVANITEGSRWPAKDLLIKMQEELGELAATHRGNGDPEMEVGDILFALLAYATERGIDVETGLDRAVVKHQKTVGTKRAEAPR
jgi:NTP pyrophosphatase (non-canonical NTP hydrolase)